MNLSREECNSLIDATVKLEDGSQLTVVVSGIDWERVEGITVRPFEDAYGNWNLFVLFDPAGNSTDRIENGKVVHGKSFFHYLNPLFFNKFHLADNDYTNLVRGNWQTAKEKNQGSRQEKRFRASLKRKAETCLSL